MNPTKLAKIRGEIEDCRRGTVRALDLQRIAHRLGLKRGVRGKEPPWLSENFKNLRPISIPDHGGKDLKPGTKNSILDDLEGVCVEWESLLEGTASGKSND